MIRVRSPVYNRWGTVDCEVDFGDGWGPYTASPDDPPGAEIYKAAMKLGPGPYDPIDPAEVLRLERESMVVSVRQARSAIGPEVCAALDALAADEQLPWALRQTIAHATEWRRLHPTMDEIGWALGFDRDEIDALFRLAATL